MNKGAASGNTITYTHLLAVRIVLVVGMMKCWIMRCYCYKIPWYIKQQVFLCVDTASLPIWLLRSQLESLMLRL